MLKMLFFDYRDFEIVEGFTRVLQPPDKSERNPVLRSDHPVEGDWMSLYGSVIRCPEDGLWQMWYTVRPATGLRALAYAESADGVEWHRPASDVVVVDGQGSHLVFDQDPHGATVIYDDREERPEWKYKLLAGAMPSGRISAYHSGDGIHWLAAAENPVIGTNPHTPGTWMGQTILWRDHTPSTVRCEADSWQAHCSSEHQR